MLAERMGIAQLKELAGRRRQLTGQLALADLPRLRELVAAPQRPDGAAGPVDLQYRTEVRMGAYGFPELVGSLDGSVELECQRCLGALEWPVGLRYRLAVVATEADLEALAERFEALVAGDTGIALCEVLEDELLVSLPLAPKHPSVAKCAPGAVLPALATVAGRPVEQELTTAGETTRPFANLQELLEAGNAEKGRADHGSASDDNEQE